MAATARVVTPLLGESRLIRDIRERIDRIASCDAAVLITGESGTGKERAARRLHELSARAHRPFVALNCAAFPEALLEGELFGHERGAFTGATERRGGRFRAAEGGTLFLDEVADMPAAAQAKLLRVLDHGGYEPLGSDATVAVDVRIVSATNADLEERILRGQFRGDIYHRLKVFRLHMPPLRMRGEDLPLLVAEILRDFSGTSTPPQLSARVWQALRRYSFPGNVRELEHVLQHALVLAGGARIELAHLPEELGRVAAPAAVAAEPVVPLAEALRRAEREHLYRALEQCGQRRAQAASLLGVSRKTLWRKLQEHGLERPKRVSDVAPQPRRR
ncbi:MAG: sigma-54-dependent Fis family transcriptional regulator [Myxococcales bacterium]|nr:sigma-54-dependent Fis family transcriptional regulator [Myxococcales bacterium]